MKLEHTSGELSGVDLLISLLVRFPEILTIHYNLAESIFKLSFMLNAHLEPERYTTFRKDFFKCLKAYYKLLQFEPITPQIHQKQVNNWTLLQIVFHKNNISFEEIHLVNNMILNEFKKEIITDNRGDSCLYSDRDNFSEDFIECLLPDKKKQEKKNLFAFREAGKVYVFDK